MTKQEYEDRIAELEHQVEEMQLTFIDVINRNVQLAQQVDAYYDVRRRVQMLKELVIRHKELLKNADLRDDEELMAIIETKLEESLAYQDPDYGLKDVAELVGTTQSRIVDLFRRSPVHKTVDDYLDYLRLLRSMVYLREKPMWGVAACAQEAGFSVIRTFNRKFQDAIGMTPHEFRMLLADGKSNMERGL